MICISVMQVFFLDPWFYHSVKPQYVGYDESPVAFQLHLYKVLPCHKRPHRAITQMSETLVVRDNGSHASTGMSSKSDFLSFALNFLVSSLSDESRGADSSFSDISWQNVTRVHSGAMVSNWCLCTVYGK